MRFKGLIIVVLMVLLFTGCSQIIDQYSGAVDSSDTSILLIEIPKGSSANSIADILIENDLIQNTFVFKEVSKETGADVKFQAGIYELSRSMVLNDIIEKIASGDAYIETVTFTIPEGFEQVQIIERLVAKELVNRDVFIETLKTGEFNYAFLEGVDRELLLEGFLFPDTYEIKVGSSEVEIINIMLNKFNEVFKEEYYAQLDVLGVDMNELITMASIIEREAMWDIERPVISSVFYNRINIRMPLQSCATVQYVLGERKEFLSIADTQIESEYNTYVNAGLPPSPIASPGEKSIIAALYPADTNFLYFVTKETNDGSHYFSATYEQHLEYKNRK